MTTDLKLYFRHVHDKRAMQRAIRGRARPECVSPQQWAAWQRGRVGDVGLSQLQAMTRAWGAEFTRALRLVP